MTELGLVRPPALLVGEQPLVGEKEYIQMALEAGKDGLLSEQELTFLAKAWFNAGLGDTEPSEVAVQERGISHHDIAPKPTASSAAVA